MRYAVDRITAGTEKEVDANEFSSMSYIPFKLSRFFCPECGETVYWRAQGGTHSSHFFHKTKAETTPECDKRVDGRSELFIYERVGLPLYLSSVGRIFQLNIGFPSVGNDAISAAANRRISVKIASSTHNRTVMINQSNFIPDRMTLIPVNFVPINGENYKITTEGGLWYNRKWSDYADGFAYAGAIFSYGESGGKKIRRGDSISPSSHYYVVTKHLMSFYSEVQYSFVSNIRLNNDDYKIYEMAISVSHKDAGRYSLISSYFREYYGVWLLDTVPEIMPLWPPVVERDVLIPTTHNSLMCSVTTGNSEPSVFTYTGNVVNSLPVVTDKRNNHTLKISLLGNENIISVDRKYVGREVTIQKKKIHRHNYGYEFSIKNLDGDVVSLEELHQSDFESDVEIYSNAKMEVVLYSEDYMCTRLPLRKPVTLLAQKKDTALLQFAVENAIVYSALITDLQKNSDLLESEILKSLKQNMHGICVPVPYWVRLIIKKWQDQGFYSAIAHLEREISKGKIPIGLIKGLVLLLDE